jgi:endogenous inhibitor of DNA gyrase (YacG/DUF329 family)
MVEKRLKTTTTPSTTPPAGTAMCPICDRVLPAEPPHRPFCSDRCRKIDLGRWLKGNYTVSRPIDQADLEEV